MANWAISKKANVLVPVDADTKQSRYGVMKYVAFRKFKRRDDARAFKQSLRNPQAYSIINVRDGVVVR